MSNFTDHDTLYGLHIQECAPYTETDPTKLLGGKIKNDMTYSRL